MQKVVLIVRIVAGLGLIVFGLNKFVPFMPGMDVQPAAQEFMGALVATGYMFPTIALFEILIGVLFVLGLFMPLATVMLFPLALNFVLFHLNLDPGNLIPALVFLIIDIFFMFIYRNSLTPLLRTRK